MIKMMASSFVFLPEKLAYFFINAILYFRNISCTCYYNFKSTYKVVNKVKTEETANHDHLYAKGRL